MLSDRTGVPQPSVAVIGAGISGLACALGLTERGFTVVVHEKESDPGGRMVTRATGRFRFDHGASFVADCYTSLIALARRTGVEVASAGPVRHMVVQRGSVERVRIAGLIDVLGLSSLSASTRMRLIKFAVETKLRHADLDFFDLSTIPPHLNATDAYEHCRETIGEDFADYVVDAFTSAMMFHPASEITAGAFLALFTMMVDGVSFSVSRIRGGMEMLPRAIGARVRLCPGSTVTAVEPSGDHVLVRTADGMSAHDAVVLAVPAPAAARLLAASPGPEAEVLAGTSYSSTIIVAFRAPRTLLDDVHVIYIPRRESALIAEVTAEAFKVPDSGDRTWSLLLVGLHDAAARELLAAPDPVIFSRVQDELRRVVAWRFSYVDLAPYDLQRWPYAMPRFIGAHVDRVRRFWESGQGARGVWLCGDYLNHPWLEGAVRCGQRVAREIASARGQD